tara:strand:+ start:285 stop:461 length:177 start_codon:yes stop_codon:yes gene_type:complete
MCKNVLSLLNVTEKIKIECEYNLRYPKCNELMSQNKTTVKVSKIGMKAMKYKDQHFSG